MFTFARVQCAEGPQRCARASQCRTITAKAAVKPAASKAKAQRGPKADGRKIDLALQVVTAALSLPGLSKDEKQMVANWVHHLPTGGGTGSARRWPKGAPKPQRSDWA